MTSVVTVDLAAPTCPVQVRLPITSTFAVVGLSPGEFVSKLFFLVHGLLDELTDCLNKWMAVGRTRVPPAFLFSELIFEFVNRLAAVRRKAVIAEKGLQSLLDRLHFAVPGVELRFQRQSEQFFPVRGAAVLWSG